MEMTEFVIENNAEVLDTAKAISDCMSTLPLTSDQHNKLAELLLDYYKAALYCGFDEGVRFTKEMRI